VWLLLGDDTGRHAGDVTEITVSANNNNIASSVSDAQPTVDNVVVLGVNNNYQDTETSSRKLCV